LKSNIAFGEVHLTQNPSKTETPQENSRQTKAVRCVLVILSLSFCRKRRQLSPR